MQMLALSTVMTLKKFVGFSMSKVVPSFRFINNAELPSLQIFPHEVVPIDVAGMENTYQKVHQYNAWHNLVDSQSIQRC